MKQGKNQGADRVVRNTLVGNVLLSTFKLIAGILGRSAAMVSDAVHSFSDVMADCIVLIGVRMANKESDRQHPYGHERMECVAGILLGFILFVVGGMIGWGGLGSILNGQYDALAVPGLPALIAAVASIVIKEGMYHYTMAAAKRYSSVSLKASAWHHRSDALSSVGSFVGILGARMGLPVLDAAACVVICVLILKVAVDVFKEAVDKMLDTASDEETEEKIRTLALKQHDVKGVDAIRTRLFGDRIYVEVEIAMDGSLTLEEAHHVADHVHDAIEEQIPRVKHCMVHVNPVEKQPR